MSNYEYYYIVNSPYVINNDKKEATCTAILLWDRYVTHFLMD